MKRQDLKPGTKSNYMYSSFGWSKINWTLVTICVKLTKSENSEDERRRDAKKLNRSWILLYKSWNITFCQNMNQILISVCLSSVICGEMTAISKSDTLYTFVQNNHTISKLSHVSIFNIESGENKVLECIKTSLLSRGYRQFKKMI